MIRVCIITLVLEKCIDVFFDKIISTFKILDIDISKYALGTVFDLHIKELDKVLKNCVMIKKESDFVIVRCMGVSPNMDLTIKNNSVIDIKIVNPN